ncbi:MAG: hypothetical protein QW702_01290 [Candidatus Bathyarchaeia archaeon]
MMCGCKRIIISMLLLSLTLVPLLAAAKQTSTVMVDEPTLEKRAEAMLSLADKAKARVEILLNSILANETLMEMIEDANLTDYLRAANETFNLGVSVLESAHTYYSDGNYTDAISLAMKAMGYFRDAYRELNNILCKLGVLKDEVIRGQGLLIAIQCALERIEMTAEALERIANRNGIDVTNAAAKLAAAKLNEAKEILDIEKAKELLQRGNVSDVAHMLAEANRLIAEAFKDLKNAIREKVSERIERFKGKLERLRERVKEKLREMNVAEREFFERWNFTNSEEFWRKQLEILERVRERLRLREGVNATELGIVGRKMHEVCLELELRLREHEGENAKKAKIEVDLEKIVEAHAGRRVTVTLRITVRNAGNTTVTFPNSAFGIIIERERNGRWELYASPISAQVLRDLKPEDVGWVEIKLTAAEPGNYRVVVRALSREGLQTVATKDFEIP